MRVTIPLRYMIAALACCPAFVWTAVAAEIQILNASFEDPQLADGTFVTTAPNWTISPGGEAGVQDLTNSSFPGATAPGTGVPHGKQIAFLNWASTLSQTLGETVQPNVEYVLTVSVGDRLDTVCGPYAVQLWAGQNLLGSDSPTPVNGAFVEASVTYTALAIDPAVGQPLRIVLRKEVAVSGDQVTFDAVRLTATPVPAPLLAVLPDGGEFTGSVQVRLSSSLPAAEIRFTLDGTEPTSTSTPYTAPLLIQQTATLRTRLFLNGFPVSEEVTATFTKRPEIIAQPSPGYFTNSVLVSLLNQLPAGEVLFTTDGSEPMATSQVYSTPILINVTSTIKARVFLNGFPASGTFVGTFSRVYAIDDGITSEWRESYFGPGYLTDPRVAADADPDADGWKNLVEFQVGSDPTDPNSIPELIASIRAVPRITWTSIPGIKYRIWRKASLNDPEWTLILPTFTATDTVSSHVDVAAPVRSVYRIEMVP